MENHFYFSQIKDSHIFILLTLLKIQERLVPKLHSKAKCIKWRDLFFAASVCPFHPSNAQKIANRRGHISLFVNVGFTTLKGLTSVLLLLTESDFLS